MGSIENFLLARIAEDESAVETVAEPIRSRLLAILGAVRRAVAMRVIALKACREHHGFVAVSDYDAALWDMLTVFALP